MATGDLSGRILLWRDFVHSNRPIKTTFHWHTLPVRSVCFSSEGKTSQNFNSFCYFLSTIFNFPGGYLFSGGDEKVLIKWRLDSAAKQVLPRMGSAIRHIVNAPGNECVATSHADNAIRFIDPTNKVERAVVSLVKHDPIKALDESPPDEAPLGLAESILPTGLVWDPRSRGVFLNGQAGFLQLFDPHRSTMLFNMDVANRNTLTDERHRAIGNCEVMRAAASLPDGRWLATLESWAGLPRDTKLKFWRYNDVRANYELNTEVSTPHRGGIVTAMTFQPPTGEDDDAACLVTIGTDRKFKIWRLADDTDIYRTKEAWTCDVAGDFRQLVPGSLSFSEDGSLLAISFDDTIALWNPVTSGLNTTLSHHLVDEPIRWMHFGRDKCFRFLVCATDRSLLTWDVITQGLVWKVGQLPGPVASLAADPKSTFMAAALKNGHVFVFEPSSSRPVYHHKPHKESPAETIAAVFVPRPVPLSAASGWLAQSRLLLFNSAQNFYHLEDKNSAQYSGGGRNKLTSRPVSHMDSLPWTPFAAMKAQQQISAAKDLKPIVHEGVRGVAGYESIQSVLISLF